MKLICEVHENLEFITEANDAGGKNYFIQGPFMEGGIKNKNGRIYPVEILARECERYSKDYIDQNRAYGELGHPAGPTINLERVSHMIKSLHQDGQQFIGRAKVLDTPYGQIVKNLMSEGAKLGVSSRGMGSLKEKHGYSEVQNDYFLATAADIVADPSAPNAFVKGIMEEREWIYNNGIFKEIDIDRAKTAMNQAVRSKNTESTILKIFESFMKKL
jgi:hypothetical protein